MCQGPKWGATPVSPPRLGTLSLPEYVTPLKAFDPQISWRAVPKPHISSKKTFNHGYHICDTASGPISWFSLRCKVKLTVWCDSMWCSVLAEPHNWLAHGWVLRYSKNNLQKESGSVPAVPVIKWLVVLEQWDHVGSLASLFTYGPFRNGSNSLGLVRFMVPRLQGPLHLCTHGCFTQCAFVPAPSSYWQKLMSPGKVIWSPVSLNVPSMVSILACNTKVFLLLFISIHTSS